jgi:hypothetical protein
MEWHQMIQKLLKVSLHGFDGDGAFFDARFNLRQLLLIGFSIIVEWTIRDFPPPLKRLWTLRFETLFLGVLDAIHKAGSFCFMTMMGILSGFFLTTILNCITLLMHFILAWYKSAPTQYKTAEAFHRFVQVFVFGDDNLVAVAEEAIPFFNFQTVQAYFAEMRMTFTA